MNWILKQTDSIVDWIKNNRGFLSTILYDFSISLKPENQNSKTDTKFLKSRQHKMPYNLIKKTKHKEYIFIY